MSDHPDLAALLLAMAARDAKTRDRLAAAGLLRDGYHPEMRAVHEANAEALARIVASSGWPDETTVGPEAAEAAWLVVQHAISRPDLVRAVVPLLASAVAAGRAPAAHLAYLTDRICFFEGRPQRYGTQFDHDDEGMLAPYPVEDPAAVESLRAEVGLEALASVTRRVRLENHAPMTAEELRSHRQGAEAFAREVGWR